MKFLRTERAEPIQWTPRKLALASSAPHRRHQREAARLPLLAHTLADPLPEPPPFDAGAALAARQRAADRLDAALRALEARVWREARRDYFAADDPQRRAIRQAWAAWRGPARALYFRYVVDEHIGVNERRQELARAREREFRRKLAGQGALDFEAAP